MYLGHTVGLRRTTISYKNKTIVQRPESEQFLVENTHPPLISQEQWQIVQEVRQHKKRIAKQMDEPNLFSGLVFCADCGKPMVLHRATTMKKLEYNFKCYTRYLVFFKGRDADVITAAFREFSAKNLSREKAPSIRRKLEKAQEQSKTQHKEQERGEKVKTRERSVER